MRFLTMIAASIALSGCLASGTTPQTPASIAPPAERLTLAAAVKLVEAHNAYQAAASIATVAVNTGRLSRPQLLALRSYNERATWLLEGGGTALTLGERVAELDRLSASIRNLIKG